MLHASPERKYAAGELAESRGVRMLVDTVLVVLLQDSGSGYCGCSTTKLLPPTVCADVSSAVPPLQMPGL